MNEQHTIWKDLETIRQNKPLVLNVTNVVVTNITANVLLALGASPAMSVSREDIADLTPLAGALVLNMGTPDQEQIKTMEQGAEKAVEHSVPVVLDPVGAGASRIRTETPLAFLKQGWVNILRGNASEIMALAGSSDRPRGVDSLHGSDQALSAALHLTRDYGCVVCVSGEQDLVVSRDKIMRISNGHAMMTLVTGMGCSSTCLIAAFAAVNRDFFQAAAGGMAIMGISGQKAASQAQGPGSLQVHFLDGLYNFEQNDLQKLQVQYQT
ncbi:MAG: hydroxyethylthiazole kinase [Desulfonatronovibrionaceae bacterium]